MALRLHTHHRSPGRALSRVARVVFVLMALAQLFGGIVASMADARPTSSIGAHAEQQGGRQHYTHDESYCAACVARHLVGSASKPTPMLPVDARPRLSPSTEPVETIAVERVLTAGPRAPPSPELVG